MKRLLNGLGTLFGLVAVGCWFGLGIETGKRVADEMYGPRIKELTVKGSISNENSEKAED